MTCFRRRLGFLLRHAEASAGSSHRPDPPSHSSNASHWPFPLPIVMTWYRRLTLASFKQKMIDAMVSSSDGVAGSPRAAQQDIRQPLKRRREARWHLPRNRTTGALAQSSVIRTATNANKSPQHAERACADESDVQVAAPPMAPGLARFDIEPPATPESTTPLKDVREPSGLKPDIIRPPVRD
jgi:hypothetical protein